MEVVGLIIEKEFMVLISLVGIFGVLTVLLCFNLVKKQLVENNRQSRSINKQILDKTISLEKSLVARSSMLENKLEFILKRSIEDHSEIMRRMEELQDELINLSAENIISQIMDEAKDMSSIQQVSIILLLITNNYK